MEEILIEKVREHEVIYNHGSPDYRNQHIRQAAWEEIGRELQIPGNKAKECWDKLRRCLCNARNRRRDYTRRGIAAKKKSPWKYEQQMSFIIPFLESRKTHGNLNESQASANLTESEESEAEENAPRESEYTDVDTADERASQDNHAADDEAVFSDAGNVKKRYKAVTRFRNKNPKKLIGNPAHQMVKNLKQGLPVRKPQNEEKSVRPQASNAISPETLDETDMFFLSMSRMTKQLPKVEQAQIKLALSNSVLSAEVRCNQESLSSTADPQHSFHQHPIKESPSPVPSSIQSVR